MPEYFILKDRKPVPVASLEEWAREFEVADRHVADDVIGEVRVSTVFLGVNHRLFGDGPPLLFETMIFGGPLNGEQFRYSSWDDAEAGHAAQVKRVRQNLN